ncbi:MAG TPA: hypothetical protein VN455_07475, partial [Methanotrichaceae archaeon]|nr:hypothetical protein [Methanotrichaceae archaeon]
IYNTAAVGAGICNAGTMTMNGGSVDHNIATMGSAGGIYNFVGTMNLKGVSISNNIASVYGGGIYNWGTMTADECAIDHNTANIGGGIYNSGGDDISNVTMNGGSISYNDATGVGGGIYNIVGSAFLNGVSIDHNTAIYGGGILNTQSNVSMNCGSIDHNIAKGYYDSNYPYEYYPGLGGGIASFLGNVCLDGVSLDHNIAYYGGGIYHLGGEANLNDATISSNSAGHYDQNSNWVADGYGGGIWNGVLDNPSYGGLKFIGTVNLNSSSISYNDAGVGGGIYNDQSIVNLISGSIDHNMAQSHGGGIYNGGSVTGNAALVHDNIPDDIYP